MLLALLKIFSFFHVVDLPASIYFYLLVAFLTLVFFHAMVFLLYCVIDVHLQVQIHMLRE